MENYNDFESMRSQMALLKKKIESQQIVNERMIKTVMNSKMRSFASENLLTMVVAMGMLPFLGYWLTQKTTLSLAFIITTLLLLLIGLITSICSRRYMTETIIADNDLIVTARKIHKLRRIQALQVRYGIPIILLWFAWYVVEILVLSGQIESLMAGNLNFGFILGLACAAFYIFWGLRSSRRRTCELKEMEQQIEDFTTEKEV